MYRKLLFSLIVFISIVIILEFFLLEKYPILYIVTICVGITIPITDLIEQHI